MTIEQIKQHLSQSLSAERYAHSLGVSGEARRLAAMYGADEAHAELAGMAHDCAKEFPHEKMLELCTEYGIELEPVFIAEKKLLHAVVGAEYTRRELGIDDDGIYDAIRYHTTAKQDMPLLTKIIYLADYTEPNRNYPGVDEIRKIAYTDLDIAILKGLDYTISRLVSRQRLLCSATVDARNFLLIQLRGD